MNCIYCTEPLRLEGSAWKEANYQKLTNSNCQCPKQKFEYLNGELVIYSILTVYKKRGYLIEGFKHKNRTQFSNENDIDEPEEFPSYLQLPPNLTLPDVHHLFRRIEKLKLYE